MISFRFQFVVVVNSDYEVADDPNNSSWGINDYQNEDDEQQHYSTNADENKGNGSLKRKFSDDIMVDENDLLQEEQYSPQANSSLTASKKPKRCRFWPDCNNRDQCDFVHPTQRCTYDRSFVNGMKFLQFSFSDVFRIVIMDLSAYIFIRIVVLQVPALDQDVPISIHFQTTIQIY